MPRVLLLLPTATYRAPDFLAAARRSGIEVVVGCDQRQTVGPALVVDLDRPETAVETIVAEHARAPLDAIVAVDDQGVLLAALASARLGLVHNPADAVAATRDKAELRRRLTEAGLDQPPFASVGAGAEAAAVMSVGLPCVVKPRSLSASRGVIRADDVDGAIAAAGRVRAIVAGRVRAIVAEAGKDAAGAVLIERFVPGVEVAVEGLLDAGRLDVLAVFDKPDPLDGPYFEETIYVTPSRLPATTLKAVNACVAAAAVAIGLVTGPVHAEVRIDGDRVVLIELAARSIGGHCSRVLRFGAGISLEELILAQAVGRRATNGPTPVKRESAAGGVMMLPIPRSGVLRGVGGQAAARAVPGIAGLEITVPLGRTVRSLPEGDRYLGFLFARGDGPASVEASLRAAYRCLDVVISASDDPA